MRNNIFRKFTIFKNELGSVRTLKDVTGDAWFLLNDIEEILGKDRTYRAYSRSKLREEILPEDIFVFTHKEYSETGGAGRFWEQISSSPYDYSNKTFVNEGALYQLIFTSHSEKAKEFQRWITHTVLPSINNEGGYIMDQENVKEAARKEISAVVRKLSAQIKDAEKARNVAQRNEALAVERAITAENKKAKLESHLEDSEKFNEKLISENVELYKEVQELRKASLEKENDKSFDTKEPNALTITVPRGPRYSVGIRDSLVYQIPDDMSLHDYAQEIEDEYYER